ncbi:hypothetical protein [Streptomyces sp. VRA16 Mangrove soil]|uniref:hypothetical protein n=1 Tax=Streptomyces sp. VRA16 Mangrove soil TaxID=2817434 RepID=UPI001A9FF3E8|nr:hypothetical protein [Streptomyces sp. VRA16 Mangrove soil]MBO1330753.1 hypothetical protein [Streptomyces sp. VRA16 Mangrove soil]
MHRLTRRTTTALATVALLTTAATACSGSVETPRAASSKEEAGAAAPSPARTVSRPDHERLDDEARSLLTGTGRSGTDDGFVASGTLAIPGQNLDETIKAGTSLHVEVACAGKGTVTFTAESGTAEAVRRVDCAQSVTTRFRFTTAAPRLAVRADSATPETVGTAYVVRRVD